MKIIWIKNWLPFWNGFFTKKEERKIKLDGCIPSWNHQRQVEPQVQGIQMIRNGQRRPQERQKTTRAKIAKNLVWQIERKPTKK
jgi:hypothetical protein